MSGSGYIPEPQPVQSEIELTAFYYPGTDQMSEWDQVAQTLPGIRPLLGWYDEGNPENIDWQIKWAVEHGISSFCVDWYWNRGEQRLDHWIKGYYRARFRKYLKWYIMWANHNQPGAHSRQDMEALSHFWVENYFNTPEYYTLEGKPVVVIWNLEGLDADFIAEAAKEGETLQHGEGLKRALDICQAIVKQAGLPGVYFIGMYQKIDEVRKFARIGGVSSFMMYNYKRPVDHYAEDELEEDDKTGRKFSYSLVVKYSPVLWERTSLGPEPSVWPIMGTGWDDRPRSFQDASVCRRRSPELFGELCRKCRAFCEEHHIRRAVVAPVNEWQEGTYVEPNEEFGFGMLDALRDAFCTKTKEGWPPNLQPSDVGRPLLEFPAMEHRKLSSWNFEKEEQGWYRNPYGTAHIAVQGGNLCFRRSFSRFAALRTRIAPLDASVFRCFQVRMKVTPNFALPAKGDEKVMLYWGTQETPIFNQELCIQMESTVTVPLLADAQWHEYELPLAGNPLWRGMVDELWFDPGFLIMADVEVAWMKLI